jgi:hypothetical protein
MPPKKTRKDVDNNDNNNMKVVKKDTKTDGSDTKTKKVLLHRQRR